MSGETDQYAFPREYMNHVVCPGLTKRELFAAMAMQGLLANIEHMDFDATLAVDCADELITALEKKEST